MSVETTTAYPDLETSTTDSELFIAEAGVAYEPEPELLRSWIHLANLPLSSRLVNALLARFHNNPQEIFEAANSELEETPALQAKHLVRIRSAVYEAQERQINWFYRNDVKLITLNDPLYPESLREINDPPAFLFIRGTLPPSSMPSIGIVGSRRATPYGKSVAERFARELASQGLAVVSGGAMGIDTSAHFGAVESGGVTVAVLGCGLDVDYPRENRGLFERIIKEGALVSEYPPGAQPDAWRFPLRNRIISGMTLGTLVVEAPVKSGALITAERAAEQGKVLMSVPGNIDRVSSSGSNDLLRSGATPILDVQDILFAVGLIAVPAKASHQGVMSLEDAETYETSKSSGNDASTLVKKPEKQPDLSALSESQKRMIESLNQTPQHIDALAGAAQISVGQAGMDLTLMELSQLVKRLPGNAYIRTF